MSRKLTLIDILNSKALTGGRQRPACFGRRRVLAEHVQTAELIDQIARWRDFRGGIVLARLAQDVRRGSKLVNRKGGVLSMSGVVLTDLGIIKLLWGEVLIDSESDGEGNASDGREWLSGAILGVSVIRVFRGKQVAAFGGMLQLGGC